MKATYRRHGLYWLVALTIILSMLLSACGDPTPTPTTVTISGATGTGQIESACDGKGEVTGQILVLTDPKQQDLKSATTNLTLITSGSTETKTFTTDADGTYTIKDLAIDEYELEASIPGGLDGKVIEPRKKYLTIDDCYIETVSMVLVAQGIEIPTAPANTTQPQVVYVNNQPHYSIANNPFFWLWLFDRPHSYGYNYPPVYTTRVYNTNNTIYVPQSRPVTDNRYKLTNYADSGSNTPGVKAAPAQVSKGTTRLGSSGYIKPPVAKSSSSSGSSTSKGNTRTNSGTDSNKTVPHPSSNLDSGSGTVPHPSGTSSSKSSSSGSSSNSGSGSTSGSSSTKSTGGNGSSSSKSSGSSSSSKGSTRSGKR